MKERNHLVLNPRSSVATEMQQTRAPLVSKPSVWHPEPALQELRLAGVVMVVCWYDCLQEVKLVPYLTEQ